MRLEAKKRMEKNGDKDGNVSNSSRVGGLAKERGGAWHREV